MTLRGLQGQSYQLESKPFSSGGEGDVYGVIGATDKVVKVYHADRITSELEQKLNTMAKRPPSSRVLSQVAWPLDVVYDQNNRFCGFVMPRLSITAELSEIYVYPPKTNITYQQKLILAQNICVVISEVHKAGYVFGDFNPRNIGVNTNTGTVAFLDTDSYHIVVDKANNKAFRCNVCAPGYAAPELLEKCAQHVSQHPEDSKRAYAATPLDTFTKETDNFALAIHMFKLLMNGYTPFGGIKETESASVGSPGVGDAAVRRDSYCFKPGNKPQAAAIPPLDTLPQEIADLFTRAFMYGRIDPKQRPSALEWHKALNNYENSLKKCNKNPAHMYLNTLHSCPWCEADDRYAASIAPSISQKGFQTPVSPNSSVNRPPVTTTPSSGASGSGSYIGAAGSNTPTTGGSTYTAPVRPAPAPPTFFQKYKGWIIAAVVLVFILLVKSCSSSSTPKSSVEILTGDSTVSVGETVQIRIRSTTSRVTANYDADTISIDWGSTQQQSGGYYLIYADVTGLSAGNSTLKIYLTGNESVYDTIAISVKSSSTGTQPPQNSGNGNSQTEPVAELNDGSSPDKAIVLTVNAAKRDSLESGSDVNWYKLDLDAAGTVTFNFSHDIVDSTATYWRLWVYAKNDTTNALMLTSFAGKDIDIDSQLLGLDAGTYYVKIAAGSSYSSTAQYALTAKYAATSLCEMEDNDKAASASLLTVNNPHVGSIDAGDDIDWFVFTLTESGTVTFNFSHDLVDSTATYWRMWVYDSSNYSGYEGDLKELMSHSFAGKDANVDCQLLGLNAGTYYVKIAAGSSYSSTKQYALTANYTATSLCEMEGNDSASSASLLTVNNPHVGSIDAGDDIDWFVFTLTESGTVTFNFSHDLVDSTATYWRMWVYDSSNYSGYEGDLKELMSHLFAGKDANVNCQLLGLDAGTYYVKIAGGSSYSSTKQYSITANYTATTLCEMEDNDKAASASLLTANNPYVGSIDAGDDIDWFVFTLTESGTVTFNFSHDLVDSTATYWRMWVYDSSNYNGYEGDLKEVLSRSIAGKDTNTDSQLSGLAAGTYYVKIAGGSSYSSAMQYTLTIKK